MRELLCLPMHAGEDCVVAALLAFDDYEFESQ